MFPENGCLRVYGVGEDGVTAFTRDGIECLQQIIADERAARRAPSQVKPAEWPGLRCSPNGNEGLCDRFISCVAEWLAERCSPILSFSRVSSTTPLMASTAFSFEMTPSLTRMCRCSRTI